MTHIFMPSGSTTAIVMGQRFGRWVIKAEDFVAKKANPKRGRYFKCACACGTQRTVRLYDLTRRNSRSCGCLGREMKSQRMTDHGESTTTAYRHWYNMNTRFPDEVCDEWQSYQAFKDDMGDPEEGYSIARHNSEKAFSCANCAWIPTVDLRFASQESQGAVEGYCPDSGEVVYRFRSVSAAGAKLGVNPAWLTTVVKSDGVRKCKKVHWRYAK